MELTIPRIKLKRISRRFKKADCRGTLKEFYRLLAHFKKVSDNYSKRSGWVTVYKSQLEDITIDYLEMVVIMCEWGIIEILYEEESYKLKLRIVNSLRATSKQIYV